MEHLAENIEGILLVAAAAIGAILTVSRVLVEAFPKRFPKEHWAHGIIKVLERIAWNSATREEAELGKQAKKQGGLK